MARKKSAKATTSKTALARRSSPDQIAGPGDYGALLDEIKGRIRSAQIKASLAVNSELIGLYWSIGHDIVQRQHREGWGQSVVDRLANDLRREFPSMTGFSAGNIRRMRAFYLAWAEPIPAQPARELKAGSNSAQLARELATAILPSPVAEMPWFHNVVLIEKLKDRDQRVWYALQTIANGWSRSMLAHWIESDLYARQGKAITNFPRTLPAPQSDLAQQLLKDPRNFDFLTLAPTPTNERRKTDCSNTINIGGSFIGQHIYQLAVPHCLLDQAPPRDDRD